MLTSKIESQDFVVRILRSHLKTDRVSHTYLFTGEGEAGKEEMALAFASALNCLEKKAFQECECLSCRKIEKKNHPDVRVLGEDETARSIKIEEIRDSIAAASLKPYEGKWKVFILMGAERLTIDASNALLKTLEEAPANTVLILTTETKANVLETIQSRSFEVRLKPLGNFQNQYPLGFGQMLKEKPWEEFLDEAASSRDNIRKTLDQLIFYFRHRLENSSLDAQAAYLEALDLLTESKDALESNVNQKLLVSRLAMRMRRAVSKEKI